MLIILKFQHYTTEEKQCWCYASDYQISWIKLCNCFLKDLYYKF